MLRNLALMLVVVCGCRALSTVQTLAGDKSFSTLVSLVTQAGLVDTLNGGKKMQSLIKVLFTNEASIFLRES
ncbi:hypothetical protein DPMN_166588 [Dreissena polymorpha]|uniref:Uncharacterized protein n=1 Tax=Dreissena polymorpha TaxID=45954 RepID=A0A9D4EZ91_DREPO|nr:hypothetical protein DPMN_166588 [Dreissena polymorpha]